MNRAENMLHTAITAVNSGKHTPNHVAVLRKATDFAVNNKSHAINKYPGFHHARAKVGIPLHAGVITRDNLFELVCEAVKKEPSKLRRIGWKIGDRMNRSYEKHPAAWHRATAAGEAVTAGLAALGGFRYKGLVNRGLSATAAALSGHDAVKHFKISRSKVAQEKAVAKAKREVNRHLAARQKKWGVTEEKENEIDSKQLKKGVKVEKEHGDHDKETDVFKKSDKKSKKGFKKIAKAHLKEIPDYYTRLGKMEKEGKKAKKAESKKEAKEKEGEEKETNEVLEAVVDRLIRRGWFRVNHDHHAEPSKPLGLHNPATFYPKGNMMSPITGKDKHPWGRKALIGGTLAASGITAAHLLRQRHLKKKKQGSKQVREAVDFLLKN